MTDNLPPLREVIAAYGLGARKSLGQNFLFDLNLTGRIARSAGDLTGCSVYEVGPGPGGLTRALLAEGAARVVAVERDERCLAALADVAAAYAGRLEVIPADALEMDEAALFASHSGPVKVVANLPYNVGTVLLIKWLRLPVWPPWWSSLTLMFQREVALRLVARPSDPDYGRLSILTQWRARPRLLFDVSPKAFVPAPKVTSTIVSITPLDRPVAEAPLEALEQVTAAAFNQRRKMLRASLRSLGDPDTLLATAGIEPTARPEDLPVAAFCALARALAARG